MSSSVTTLDRRAIPSPLYWRSWRNSPLEEPHGPPRRGANPPTVLAALGRPGTPGEAAETIHQPQPAPRRLWKLPELWTQRTRPQLLGKRTERVSHSYHSLHPASLNHRAGKWYRGAPVRRHRPSTWLRAPRACRGAAGRQFRNALVRRGHFAFRDLRALRDLRVHATVTS